MDHNLQFYILKGLFENINYFRNVSGNLDQIYFDEDKGPIVNFLVNYFAKYEKIPHYSVVVNTFANAGSYSEQLREAIEKVIVKVKALEFDSDASGAWLYDQTKEFITARAFTIAIRKSIIEIEKDPEVRDLQGAQQEVEKSLSMLWDDDLGIDYFDIEGIDTVYDKLGDNSIRIPTGIDAIDMAINGGIPGKTKFCAVFTGQAGLGKSLVLGNTALNAVLDGKNVLYITFELGQEEFRKRMDAAFTDFNIKSIVEMRDEVKKKVLEAKQKGACGRFIIKEFPPASISALDVESYLHSLKLKKQFTPDVIILDYLGIMIPISKAVTNSYERGKAVCEEIRALSDRFKCPILSAVQVNRGAYNQESVEMENIADSMGIAHTCDLIISLAQPEEYKENNQIKFQVIKSRISKTGTKGVVDVDYERLKLLSTKETTENIITEGIKRIEASTTTNISGGNSEGIT